MAGFITWLRRLLGLGRAKPEEAQTAGEVPRKGSRFYPPEEEPGIAGQPPDIIVTEPIPKPGPTQTFPLDQPPAEEDPEPGVPKKFPPTQL